MPSTKTSSKTSTKTNNMPKTSNETNPPSTMESLQPRYTRNVLLQMLAVFLLLLVVIIWQWDVVYQIYLKNQINAIGWVVNGGILLLFFCGLAVLVGRFFEYRAQESTIARFLLDLESGLDPLLEAGPRCMLAERYRTLWELNRRHASINQSALAATLMALESSRNSFPKFVHNVLILTGVFGTIISLSLALLGASDMIHGTAPAGDQASGLGTMIFGMSTALSTTLTAILAYLIFGYFYIKLTDTQTYLISRIEEVTATILLPHLHINQSVEKDYSDSVRSAAQLIERFDQSQQRYEGAVQALLEATQSLSSLLAADQDSDSIGREEIEAMLARLGEQQQRSAEDNRALLSEAVGLLREGFRLRK